MMIIYITAIINIIIDIIINIVIKSSNHQIIKSPNHKIIESSLLTAAAVQFEILSLFRFTPDEENRLIRNLKGQRHPHKETSSNNRKTLIKQLLNN